MRFRTEKKLLSDAINNIIRAVSAKSTVPALEGILLSSKNSKLELTAYDLELGMKTEIDANIQDEGSVILSAKLFSEIVRKAPSDIIEIDVNENNFTKITSGMSEFSIIGIDYKEFPELPAVVQDNNIKIAGETLKGMIRQTIFAVADNDTKPINQGSMFNFEDTTFDLISVDGFRLAVRRENLNEKNNTNFVVPGKTLSEVLKLSSDSEIEICCGRRHIMFKIDKYTIVSSILEGEFLDYKNTIPKNTNYVVTVRTRDLIESTERVSLLNTDKLKSPIRCLFSNDHVKLSSSTAIGRANDECPCKMDNENDIEIGFNNKYLLDALKNSECDMVKLHISGALNPMLITPIEGDDFMFLVLPVRLKNEN
ncbi:MAG: DNA polymerase III subunit beta [Clostridia bacterium]